MMTDGPLDPHHESSVTASRTRLRRRVAPLRAMAAHPLRWSPPVEPGSSFRKALKFVMPRVVALPRLDPVRYTFRYGVTAGQALNASFGPGANPSGICPMDMWNSRLRHAGAASSV